MPLCLSLLLGARRVSGFIVASVRMGIAVSMTVRLTPDQLAGRLSTNPKLFLTIVRWITALPNFRILAAALLMPGIGLVSIASICKSKTK
jgi:hypothetical protein